MQKPELSYTPKESEQAWRNWRANCGPHAIAAACGVRLDAVGELLEDFPGWMNPTTMKKTLLKLKWVQKVETVGPKSRVDFVWKKERDQARIIRGTGRRIARIQWEGPWLDPGKPPAQAYSWTHWVALRDGYVLDTVISAIDWVEETRWKTLLDEFCKREGYRGWHFTHILRLQKSTL